ncbi:class I SAM-dependent methyltransferase [Desulfosporosinus sp. FKA]|uniref:class I SAM-dependent methyltransferase n=1 Tax=Desulfosporosinus sp. FKA TaxID=1969834 RepID=UPI000B49B25A|nr:class I SAM-dependent methyltransferase [Desulfosporosinus sp. FKA]
MTTNDNAKRMAEKKLAEKKEKAAEMEKTARGPFAPVYPVLAERFHRESNLKNGLCIDIGSGGAQLGLEIGEISDFNIIAFDINEHALEYARENAESKGLGDKFSVLCGDVQQLPLESNSVDLIVSRGALWFWPDGAKSFGEIYRILKPEAKAFIGCGFGTIEIFDAVVEQMESFRPEWNSMRQKLFKDNPVELFEGYLKSANIKDYIIEETTSDRWIILTK